jgi:EpsD family peptidyl-prolyl cis-trans isomerase
MKIKLQSRHRFGILSTLLVLVFVAGCGKHDGGDAKKTASQVAAKVNSTEITISQINSILARNQKIPPEAVERAKREILNGLIDAELAKQEAIAKKLDRSPNVLQALEAAKTEILARAYVEQVATAQPKPTPNEVKKYYEEHPELFSQRRLYNIEEISMPAQEGLAAKLKEQVAKTRSLQDIANWLKAQSIQFTANRGARSAEQLPLALLPQLQTMKNGEMRVIEAPGGLQVLRIAASQDAPVDEARANPVIQQFLFNQRSTEAIANDRKQLKAKAKIEYVGEFAASAAEAEAKAKADADAKAKAAADAKAKAETESQAKADEISKARAAAEATSKEEAAAREKAEAAAQARRAAEAKAQSEAEAKKAAKPAQPPSPDIEKGVRGLVR